MIPDGPRAALCKQEHLLGPRQLRALLLLGLGPLSPAELGRRLGVGRSGALVCALSLRARGLVAVEGGLARTLCTFTRETP